MKALLDTVNKRLEKKLQRAEGAFVRQYTEKTTHNCHHSGRRLSPQVQACKIKWQGADEQSAAQCWDEKARGCTLFKLKKSPAELKQKFRSLSEEEIALRWPSIGSLLWIKRTIEERLKETEEEKEEETEPEQRKVG